MFGRQLTKTQHTDDTRRVSRIRLVAGTLAVAAVASFTLGSGASPASAYTTSGSGYPGAVGVPTTTAASTGYASGKMTVGWRAVYESSAYAKYDQYVCVTMNLVMSSGAKFWTQSATRTNCAWIPAAATSVNINGTDFVNLIGMNAAIYSVNFKVTWQLSNGALIGTRYIDYNHTTDYLCTTAYCAVGNTTWGGGAYVTFTR